MKLTSVRIALIAVVSLFTFQLQASTGLIVGVFQLGPSTNTPAGVAFDGANIWVGYGQGSSLPAAGVYKL